MYDLLRNELDIAMVIEEDNFTVTLMFYTDRFTYHRRQTMKYIHKCNYIDVLLYLCGNCATSPRCCCCSLNCHDRYRTLLFFKYINIPVTVIENVTQLKYKVMSILLAMITLGKLYGSNFIQ